MNLADAAMAFAAAAFGWVARSVVAGYWETRLDRNNADDSMVTLWFQESYSAGTLELLLQELPDISAGRMRSALERLEAAGVIRGGYPDAAAPGTLVYWYVADVQKGEGATADD